MEITNKLLDLRKTFYCMRPIKPLVKRSVATFGMAIMLLGLMSAGNALPAIASTASALTANDPFVSTSALNIIDDYQPPDNGGPGKTGGSGTR